MVRSLNELFLVVAVPLCLAATLDGQVAPPLTQRDFVLGGLEENCSAIGTALPLIKFRDHRSIKNIWEEQTLCRGMFGQAKASFLVSNPREQRICTIGEAFRVLKSRIFRARGCAFWRNGGRNGS